MRRTAKQGSVLATHYLITYLLTYLLDYLLIYLLTYLLTAWSSVLLERLTGFQPVKKFPAFHETRSSITAFTSFRKISLSWARSIQSLPPHPTSWRSILILLSHLRLGLPSGLFPSGFPSKTLYAPISPISATCSAHLILNLITRKLLSEEYGSLSSLLCSFLHSLLTSSRLGPNTLLSNLFSYTFSLSSSLNVSDQVSHLFKTKGPHIKRHELNIHNFNSSYRRNLFSTKTYVLQDIYRHLFTRSRTRRLWLLHWIYSEYEHRDRSKQDGDYNTLKHISSSDCRSGHDQQNTWHPSMQFRPYRLMNGW